MAMPEDDIEWRQDLATRVRGYFEARDHVRRGICLLNAGAYDEAITAFSSADRLNPESENLVTHLARCHMGRRDYLAAADQLSRLVERDPDDVTSRIRHALLLWKRGDAGEALRSLRESVKHAPDCAELHFQLGTLLAAAGAAEEAELRFTQALSLDGRHHEAMVSLAMCYAAGRDATRALGLLQRAQAIQPGNARIGHLLSVAMKAAVGEHQSAVPAAAMPVEDATRHDASVDLLRGLIEADPEIVEAFLDPAGGAGGGELYEFLRAAIEQSLARHADRAELHYQHGRLLDALGEEEQAVTSIERALRLRPADIPTLIQSAKLHHKTGCRADAIARLERTIALGARYADVYVMLGRLYRESGETVRARDAFRQAVLINGDYQEAKDSLEALSV